MTNEKLEEIKELLSKTSEGTWNYIQLYGRHGIQSSTGGSVVLFSHPKTLMKNSYNEILMARSKQYILELIKEIERLKDDK